MVGNVSGMAGSDAADDVNSGTGVALVGASSHNLIGDAATSGGLTNAVDGNIVGNSGVGTLDVTTVLDTSLANNGGPTQTHALVADSPAIDAGNNAEAIDENGLPLTTDQRGPGFTRFGNLAVDIGAVEVQPMDFGDAPDSYGTTLAMDGARHLISHPDINGLPYVGLGGTIDGESDGQPSAAADGDDLMGFDEDGVSFVGDVRANSVAVVGVNPSVDGFLAWWIDFNGNGQFDPSERFEATVSLYRQRRHPPIGSLRRAV